MFLGRLTKLIPLSFGENDRNSGNTDVYELSLPWLLGWHTNKKRLVCCEQQLAISSSLSVTIHNFGHTLLCYFNKPTLGLFLFVATSAK
jgi:hypothetical protein